MLAPKSRKRQRSDSGTGTVIQHLTQHVNGAKNASSAARPPPFAILEDSFRPEDQSTPPRPIKKKRVEPLKSAPSNLQHQPSQDVEMDLTFNRTVSPVVPSLRERIASNPPKIQNQNPVTPPNRASQLARAMMMSSIPAIRPDRIDPDAFLIPRRTQAQPQQLEPVSFPSLLKSPFRSTKRVAKEPNPSDNAIFRRPSEGTALRRPLVSKENQRRPSDSYTRIRRQSRPSFLRKPTDFSPHKNINQRKSSILDDLQKSVPKSPLAFPDFTRSPSIMSSSQAALLAPIPKIPVHLDSPGHDTDQLIADMSDFSLAPNPKDVYSSPIKALSIHEPDQVPDNYFLHTQSSPGMVVPSVEISWFQDPVINSSPIKPTQGSSSDPIDLFHPKYYSGKDETMKPSRITRSKGSMPQSGSLLAPPLQNSSWQRGNLKPPPKVYGKKANKSVQFAFMESDSEEGDANKKGKGNMKAHRPFPKSPPETNHMDDSDDELLLH